MHSGLLGHSRIGSLVLGGRGLALVLLGGLLPSEVPLIASGHGAVSQKPGATFKEEKSNLK